ncbi:MAG TPA: choice-of-anchor E domain-containing protein, partial [Phycisphaerae bacterium]|nr:choice-of-anchor E domain-containing protein [Phycisphaerae bacterium]
DRTTVTIDLQKFNSSLGTLTGITLSLKVTLSNANIQMDNDTESVSTATAKVNSQVLSFTSEVTLLKTDYTSFDSINLQVDEAQGFTLQATSGDPTNQFNATGLSDYATWSPGDIESGESGSIASVVWAQYTGSDTFSIDLKSTFGTSASFTGDPCYFQGNTPTAVFSGDVTYTYEPVPEPSTLALLGTLGTIFIIRRYRRKGE